MTKAWHANEAGAHEALQGRSSFDVQRLLLIGLIISDNAAAGETSRHKFSNHNYKRLRDIGRWLRWHLNDFPEKKSPHRRKTSAVPKPPARTLSPSKLTYFPCSEVGEIELRIVSALLTIACLNS
jgi:hypothetical protein